MNSAMNVFWASGPMRAFFRSGRKLWQITFGRDTAVERFLARRYGAMIRRRKAELKHLLLNSGSNRDNRIGIFLKGGCDLVSIFACEPFIREVLDGSCCIFHEGSITDGRSDFLLQTLQDFPQEWLDPVNEKLNLHPGYFQTQLFKKNIIVPGKKGLREFPKSVVIMSVGSDLVRSLYRHREHGFLVDPGGWWLNQDFNEVLNDLSVADWFRKNFVSAGKISVDAFMENFTQIVKLVRNNTAVPILVFNSLTVEPTSLVHNYQFVRNSPGMRQRKFYLALVELSHELDFSIVDVDRVLKRAGVNAQLDFAHFPAELYPPIAQEAVRIMRDLGVFS